MVKKYTREIDFDNVLNFRDLGGYKARGGRTIAWRRLFRSGEMHHLTARDAVRLKEELNLKTVLDLRNSKRVVKTGIGLLDGADIQYRKISLTVVSQESIDNKQDPLWLYKNSGEIYYHLVRLHQYGQRLIEALEIIASPENYPLVFHCNAGKDRSGIVAAILLSALGVADEDVVADYVMTDRYMKAFIDRWNNDPETADVHRNLPEYHLKAMPESMVTFLSALKKEYGSAEGYLNENGADSSLVKRLEKALLV
jgi:protein-tyrosine phosphatase